MGERNSTGAALARKRRFNISTAKAKAIEK
jgi:hypothetical protein